MNYKTFTGNIVHNGIFIVFIRTAVLLSLFFLLTSQRGYSQGKIITVDGREALLFPSGKWKFVKKSKREAAPHYECVYAKNHVDKMNGNVIKVMERERLVSYTPEELKKIYVTQDYLTMDAYLSNFNKRLALFIKITIRTNNPRSAYGSLFKDAKLIFKLNNGHTVTLHCGQSESGNVDYEHDKTIYMTFFELNDAAIELLQRGKIEMARLYWGKGYEDYKIIIPDFFIRQIHCVK